MLSYPRELLVERSPGSGAGSVVGSGAGSGGRVGFCSSGCSSRDVLGLSWPHRNRGVRNGGRQRLNEQRADIGADYRVHRDRLKQRQPMRAERETRQLSGAARLCARGVLRRGDRRPGRAAYWPGGVGPKRRPVRVRGVPLPPRPLAQECRFRVKGAVCLEPLHALAEDEQRAHCRGRDRLPSLYP